MKLFETLGIATPPKHVRLKSAAGRVNFDAMNRSPAIDKLGGGYYANVYGHKNRPETVIKLGRTRIEDPQRVDGYLQYLHAISKNDRMSANPYLPRVYKAKIYHNDTDTYNQQYSLEMERLSSIEDLNKDEIEAIGGKMFHNFTVDPHEEKFDALYRLTYQISDTINRHSTVLKNIKDKQFLQAIAIISNVMKKKRVDTDIHLGNIMVRRTSVGPQLVITDPLA